jgi:hypothetical protein
MMRVNRQVKVDVFIANRTRYLCPPRMPNCVTDNEVREPANTTLVQENCRSFEMPFSIESIQATGFMTRPIDSAPQNGFFRHDNFSPSGSFVSTS